MRIRSGIPLFLILAVQVGCESPQQAVEPLAPSGSISPQIAEFAAQVAPVSAVEIELPSTPRPWDTSSVALVRRIAAAEGRATVAFKNSGSPQVRAGGPFRRGMRAKVDKGSLLAGLELLASNGVVVKRYLRSIGAASVVFPDPDVAAEIAAHPLVDYVEPPLTGKLLEARNSEAESILLGSADHPSLLSQQTPWGVTKVKAPEAWSRATGFGSKVLIIDTGYDRDHPDLPLIPASNCGGRYDGCVEGFAGHGSHVMGILTARNNGIGVVGVAPGIAAADLFVWAACDRTYGQCDFGSVRDGLDQGVAWGVDVVNMSFGGDTLDLAVSNAIEQAYAAGIVLVAAAGNHKDGDCFDCGEPDYWSFPASHWRTIAVSGVNSNDAFAHPGHSTLCRSQNALGQTFLASSNYGPYVTVSAPFDAMSTVAGDYEIYCGTSMATPHVTGAIALVLERESSLTPPDVKTRLIGTVTDRGATGFDDLFGHGVLNAQRLVGPIASIMGPSRVEANAICDWQVQLAPGYGSHTYKWYRDGRLVSTSSLYQTSTGSTDFQLDLVVEDGQGIRDDRSLSVDVYDGGPVIRCTQ